jgi:DNA-binding MarR family transcriptional regulator
MREDLIEQYFEASTGIQRAMKRRVLAKLQSESISFAQIGLLFMIDENGSVISKDLATRMQISRSAIAQLLDGLSELGFITRTEDKKDRRIVHIGLSKKGKGKIKDLEKQRKAIFKELVSGLSDKQLKSAIEINSAMLKQLEK